jgi:hypothetical protein
MPKVMPLVLAAAVCASLVVALAVTRPEASSKRLQLKQGIPIEASVAQLRSFAGTRQHAVYWAGTIPSQRLELTETKRGTFVRYLPEEAEIGSKRSLYLTVATYRLPRAFAVASEAARRPGAVDRALPGGGIAVWQAARPTSVYVAHPRSGRLVEVFDPDPRRARRLILAGRVRPIAGE